MSSVRPKLPEKAAADREGIWLDHTVGMRKTKLRGFWKIRWQFLMSAAAFNLWQLPKLQRAEV